MTENRSSNSSSTKSHDISSFSSSVPVKTMDFSTLVKTPSLNLTLKLDHTNYIYWKTQVLTTIEALDLEGFITGKKAPSPKLISVRSGEIVVQQENPEFLSWKKTDKLLMSWIFSTLTPSVLGQVTNSKSSFEIWSKKNTLIHSAL